MPEQISLTEDKKTIFLGACRIFGAYLSREEPGGDDDRHIGKAVSDAIRIAKIVDRETCSEGEICERKPWEEQ
ncbi:MAG: hypothetical protein M0Z60_10070 [Nitrospiraceae bacterium]|nr:hypothetical protein [Nitrospiraceae bacterium]